MSERIRGSYDDALYKSTHALLYCTSASEASDSGYPLLLLLLCVLMTRWRVLS